LSVQQSRIQVKAVAKEARYGWGEGSSRRSLGQDQGKVQEAAGEATGDESTEAGGRAAQAKGSLKQAKGNTKQAGEKVKESINKAFD
jgi:uncharacterized protein YjbJ (UPF0337 family)